MFSISQTAINVGTGARRWIEWRSHPHGKLIYAAARDITERVSKQALIESLSRQYELVFDGTLDAIFLVQCCEDGAWRYVRRPRPSKRYRN